MGFNLRIVNGYLLPEVQCDTCCRPTDAEALVGCFIDAEAQEPARYHVTEREVSVFCGDLCVERQRRNAPDDALVLTGTLRDYLVPLYRDKLLNNIVQLGRR
jgi:hypothetical protein